MVNKLLERFVKKYYRPKNQTESRLKKLNEEKGGNFNMKWKGYENSFNSLFDKKLFSATPYL